MPYSSKPPSAPLRCRAYHRRAALGTLCDSDYRRLSAAFEFLLRRWNTSLRYADPNHAPTGLDRTGWTMPPGGMHEASVVYRLPAVWLGPRPEYGADVHVPTIAASPRARRVLPRPSAPNAFGAAGPWSKPCGAAKKGIQLAVDAINAGPAWTGSRHLEIKFEDDSACGVVAPAIAQSFVDSLRILAVIGHVTSGAMMSAARVHDKHLAAFATTATSPASPAFLRGHSASYQVTRRPEWRSPPSPTSAVGSARCSRRTHRMVAVADSFRPASTATSSRSTDRRAPTRPRSIRELV